MRECNNFPRGAHVFCLSKYPHGTDMKTICIAHVGPMYDYFLWGQCAMPLMGSFPLEAHVCWPTSQMIARISPAGVQWQSITQSDPQVIAQPCQSSMQRSYPASQLYFIATQKWTATSRLWDQEITNYMWSLQQSTQVVRSLHIHLRSHENGSCKSNIKLYLLAKKLSLYVLPSDIEDVCLVWYRMWALTKQRLHLTQW